ncbi:unnamed protein product, partial [Chrysoparadoxa australica]
FGLIIAAPVCVILGVAATRILENARRTTIVDAIWAGAVVGLIVGFAELLFGTLIPTLTAYWRGYGVSSSIGGEPMMVDGVPTLIRWRQELFLFALTVPLGAIVGGMARIAMGQP